MKKILIGYESRTGKTKQMADYIAEGIRMSGGEVDLKKLSEVKSAKDLQGYNGCVFGCPTYHRDMTQSMKTFLFLAQAARLTGKVGGAFGSYTHSGDAPSLIFDTMEHVFKMNMVDLGAFKLKEQFIDTDDGMKACQNYGKSVCRKLG